jgi:hypothetical protein
VRCGKMQKKGMGSFLARQYPNGHVSNGGRGERRLKGETWWRGGDGPRFGELSAHLAWDPMVKQNPVKKWPETRNCAASTLL